MKTMNQNTNCTFTILVQHAHISRITADKFCVTVGPVARTAGILTQSVKGTGC